MKQVHSDKVKKAYKICKGLWITCIVLAAAALVLAVLYFTTNIASWKITLSIMCIDVVAIIMAIVAKSLCSAAEDYEFTHRKKDE